MHPDFSTATRSRGGSARVAGENGLADARTSRQGSSGDAQNGGS